MVQLIRLHGYCGIYSTVLTLFSNDTVFLLHIFCKYYRSSVIVAMSNYGMPLLNGLASNVRQVPSRELTLTALYERYLINESTAKGKTTPCNEETNTLNDFETSSKDGSDQDSLCREMQSSSSLSGWPYDCIRLLSCSYSSWLGTVNFLVIC